MGTTRPGGLELTISLGVAAAVGDRVRQDSLLRAADAAPYRAKHSGRNQVAVDGVADDVTGGDRRPLESDRSAQPVS